MLSVLHYSIWSTTRNPQLARALGAVLLGTAFCYAGLAAINVLVQPLGRFDESIQILAARAIGAGLVPHRDFWFVYPDLNPWIIAAAFKLFGASYIVARSVSLMFYALVLTVAWMAVKPQLSRPVFMLGLTLGIAKLVAYSPWNAFALVLVLLLWICSDQWKVPSVVWLMRGMVVACCLLMRINFGGYVLIAMVSLISLNREISVRDKRTQGICLCAPVICAVVLYCVVYRNSLPAVYSQLVDLPLHVLSRGRILSVSILSVGLLVLPLLIIARRVASTRIQLVWYCAFLGASAATIMLDLHCRHGVPRPVFGFAMALIVIFSQAAGRSLKNAELAILLCYFLFLHYYFYRADILHIWPSLTLLSMLIALNLCDSPKVGGDRIDILILTSAVALGLCLQPHPALSMLNPFQWLSSYPNLRASLAGQADIRVELGAPNDGEVEALKFLLAHAAKRDYVYCGLLDHSQGFVNNLRDYVILDRPIPVSDWEYEPGISSEAQAQSVTVGELQRTHTSWLLLWKGVPSETGPKTNGGSTLLDSYIVSAFCVVGRFQDYQVLRRCSDLQNVR